MINPTQTFTLLIVRRSQVQILAAHRFFLRRVGISDHKRILPIEDTAEIQIQKLNVLRFEARREQNGLSPVTMRDLLRTTLRHRPDRII